MMPEQCSTIPDLRHDVIGVAVDNFVRDILLAAIINPVWIKTGSTIIDSKHCLSHLLLVSEAWLCCIQT